ncbi:CHAT domain-containing protein [uncultured Bradyrhizobium sp.]|jgi:hypothetical protein|uniref:CHAT domain-containing protein n=1 Tax=uncultured Bradyrhizobium sp. TaxID=199684 RepID=UPI002634F3A8|nr:CHAT domain-containing protein [uncultured Bradyrhizobium sp.]
MPGLIIRRNDFHLGIAAENAGKIALVLRWGGTMKLAMVAADDVLNLREDPAPAAAAAALLARLDIADEYRRYLATALPPDRDRLDRLTLQIDEPRVCDLRWEGFFHFAIHGPMIGLPVVRLSATRPRIGQISLTFPLRFLELGNAVVGVQQLVNRAFGGPPNPETARLAKGEARDFANATLPNGWPMADVVHIGPDALEIVAETMMRTADPEAVGTLGWLARVSDVWRARLIIFDQPQTISPTLLRRLAAALVSRGGPAVLIGPLPWSPTQFYEDLYAALIHDNPIDQALAVALRTGWYSAVSLFAGSGREELIRVSIPGEVLNEFATGLSQPDPDASLQATTELRQIVQSLGDPGSVEQRFSKSREALDAFRGNWQQYEFDLSERRGYIPLVEHVENIRAAMRPPSTGSATVSRAPTPPPTSERFVNPGLWSIGTDAKMHRIDPAGGGVLKPDEPIVLGIEVGPKDATLTILGAQALFEEPLRWDDGQDGVWLTVGLSGIDFDVLGDPVQEFWLPRTGASERVEFTVVPRRDGASLLRFCVYYRADLLQSYRLAVIVGHNHPLAAQRRAALATLMDAGETDIPDAIYMARLEYAATADLLTRREVLQRDVALSIFANDIDGREVITARSNETFSVHAESATAGSGKRIRALLEKFSSSEVGSDKHYAFQYGADGHTGTKPQLDAALRALAVEGWDLYSSIFDRATREKLEPELAAGNAIHVGHALLAKSLPWALVYDREYDGERKSVDGQLAQHTTCVAGLGPGEAGLPAQCGTHADCPLHPAHLQAQKTAGDELAAENTVVCPRHFWGFRHEVELPPMQVDAGDSALPDQRDAIAAANPAALMIGYNAKLPRAAGHLDKLKNALPGYAIRSAVQLETTDRDAFKAGLKGATAALIYLFCHARGGLADPTIEKPYVELQGIADPEPGALYRGDFSVLRLKGHPLVFFNGCNTAAFSPDALSPLIEAVVRDGGASGAIGTEIPVYEDLAAEFASLFLRRFLTGKTAGAAMLESRLEMLGRLNPLGIAYTLYGFNNLSITQTAETTSPG